MSLQWRVFFYPNRRGGLLDVELVRTSFFRGTLVLVNIEIDKVNTESERVLNREIEVAKDEALRTYLMAVDTRTAIEKLKKLHSGTKVTKADLERAREALNREAASRAKTA